MVDVRLGVVEAPWAGAAGRRGWGTVRGEPPSHSGAAATVMICGISAAPRVLPVPVSRPEATAS